jgi:stage V sporulation protein D (sporulation-specific penicillin-binding protein)
MLGKEKLFDYIDKFGFGSKTGIDLNGEGTGIIFNPDKITLLETATTAFGQGVSVTAIQQVQAVSAIINNGNMYTPHIVSSISEPETGQIIKSFDPVLKSENVVSEETSSLVRYALESVVANGSGRNAYIENYRVGGKTGTAQKVGANGQYMVGNYVLSFIGFMPADDPEYVIYIAIDNAKNVVQYGGTVSAPIAKNVFKEIINLYDLKEDRTGLPRLYRWYEQNYVTIPDVLNKTKKEAIKELNGLVTVEYSGTGDTVIDISPKVGTRVKQWATVKIMLN